MWELDHKESWELKTSCFRTGAGEESWESLKTTRRSNQSILKEMNPEYSLEGCWSSGTLAIWCEELTDAGKDWGQEEGATEDEVVGWHHCLNGHEFWQTLEDCGGQGSLVCCSPRGHKKSDTTEQLNNNIYILLMFGQGRFLWGRLYKPQLSRWKGGY